MLGIDSLHSDTTSRHLDLLDGTCHGPGRVEFSFATGGFAATATAFGVMKAVLSDSPDQYSEHGRTLRSKNGYGSDLTIFC